MKKKLKIYFFLGLFLAGCTATPAAPKTVQIKLTEFGILSSISAFEPGQSYRFEITNAGSLNHEFAISPQGGGMADHDMGEMGHDMTGTLLHIPEEQLAPGATVSVDYLFSENSVNPNLEFACHLPGHYEAGMFLPITVGG